MSTPVGQRTAPVPRTPPDPAPVTPPDDVSAIPMLPPTLKRSTSEACRAMSDAPPAAPPSTTGATIAALTAGGRASNGARHKRARGADAAAAAAAAAAASGVEGGRGVGTAQRYTDMTASPIVLALTQSVRKSNDRGKNIPKVRPALFANEHDVTIFFAGNGLFPLFVDLHSPKGSGFNMLEASPPSVRVFSYPEQGPAPVRCTEVDPKIWELPSFQRVDEEVYVVKLGFKKGVGAHRYFFLTVSLEFDNGASVTLTSELFKVATKPRKVVLGNLDASWTKPALRSHFRDLRERRGDRAGGRANDYAADIGERLAEDDVGDRFRFDITFDTPSRCLAFYGNNFMHCTQQLGMSCHLVPKRPGKMAPPQGVNHTRVVDIRHYGEPPVVRASTRVSSSGSSSGGGAGGGAGVAATSAFPPPAAPTMTSRAAAAGVGDGTSGGNGGYSTGVPVPARPTKRARAARSTSGASVGVGAGGGKLEPSPDALSDWPQRTASNISLGPRRDRPTITLAQMVPGRRRGSAAPVLPFVPRNTSSASTGSNLSYLNTPGVNTPAMPRDPSSSSTASRGSVGSASATPGGGGGGGGLLASPTPQRASGPLGAPPVPDVAAPSYATGAQGVAVAMPIPLQRSLSGPFTPALSPMPSEEQVEQLFGPGGLPTGSSSLSSAAAAAGIGSGGITPGFGGLTPGISDDVGQG